MIRVHHDTPAPSDRRTARPLVVKPLADWLMTATEAQLESMGILRDGRCMGCGAPPAGPGETGECPWCRTEAGLAFHDESDRLELDLAQRRARRAQHLHAVAVPDPRQLALALPGGAA
jgi:hypothetical protein